MKARSVIGSMRAEPTARLTSPPNRSRPKEAAFHAVEAMKKVRRLGVCEEE